MTGERPARDRATHSDWAVAVETYRKAVEAYRRVLDVKAARRLERESPLEMPATANHMSIGPQVGPCEVLDGLTHREREVAELVTRGYSNQAIADALVLTRGTVANHVAHVLAKLGARNRTQVAARVLEGSIVAGVRRAAPNGVSAGSRRRELA